MNTVRLDKWVWAARFFKTRALARQAIDGGKLHFQGQKSKPSKQVNVGDVYAIRQGYDEKTIIVKELSDQRKGAPEASLLYEETKESIEKRDANQMARKMNSATLAPEKRPTKKQRRQIIRFKAEC